ncbi:MAG: cytochrome ubiquinol oxidase subunit I [Bacteroidaceae bacterium]
MVEHMDASLLDWSRAQFALTAIYHWIFVPLTLGLAVIMAVMETLYVRTGDEFWKRTARFWMKLFGINFAVGVATGLILEFEFGTNWSNYSWFVGDIFGAPLAIEGILAFFMESTFVAVMFFGWGKVSRGFHLASTWLTGLGATISAWWILVANAWMQHPVGMAFNPDTVRNEMVDFWSVATSPMAVVKFFHSVLSGWVLGALFVVGISCWFLLKGRERRFSLASIRVAAIVGLVASLLSAWSGDTSGYQVARTQPMKLAALEGLYEGGNGVGLVGMGVLNPDKQRYDDGEEPFLFRIEIPRMLSMLATRSTDGYVPGIRQLLEGGYVTAEGDTALSAAEKMARGRLAIQALADYREARAAGSDSAALAARNTLDQHIAYFGYGYVRDANDLVPSVPLNFYAFRVMVVLGGYFIAFFALVLFLAFRKDLAGMKWMQWVALLSIPLGYLAGQAGWIVAECGRQPWAIQDMLPTSAAVSNLPTGAVQTTFFLFLFLFTCMLAVGVVLVCRSVRKGPESASA